MKKISVRDFEPKTLIKGVHLTQILEKKLFEKYLMKKGIYIYILLISKSKKKVYVTDYFLFHIQYEFT